MVGYLEGIDSERGTTWRFAGTLSPRAFLGYGLTDRTPDDSTLSVMRRRIHLKTHREVFGWLLRRLAEHGLLEGRTIRGRRDRAGGQRGDVFDGAA